MRKAFVLLFAALILSGCGFIYRPPVFQGNLLEKANVEQLKPGMTKAQVISLVGTPPIADPFHHERWDYAASDRRGHDPIQIKNLTLWFDDGQTLSRMEGEYFPENDAQLLIDLRRFGFFNLPKEKEGQGRRR